MCSFSELSCFKKGHPSSEEDKEFEKLEKRQQITGELEVNGRSRCALKYKTTITINKTTSTKLAQYRNNVTK